jgi:DNA-binding NarL/FixJ family response regulator
MRSSGTAPIRVYLIDDHPVVIDGFSVAVAAEPDIVLVGSATSAAEGLVGAVAARPDVLLVDLALPDSGGPQLVARLRAALPAARLVVLSGYDDEFRVAEALRAGAHGYLVKTSKMSEVIEGIRRSAAGGAALSPRIAGAVMRAMRKPSGQGTGALDALTTRERQVLRLLAMGVSTREAAARLTISPKTVETHRVRIYTKLGCKSAVELTRIAVRTGMIEA